MRQVPLRVDPVAQHHQLDAVRSGDADLAFVRLPVDKAGLNVIPLYTELSVVVAPKDHPIAAFEEIEVGELADEYLLADPNDFPAWRDISTQIREGTRKPLPAMASVEEALDLVEAGLGILILPMSVARHFNRKALRARVVTGVPESGVGLAWLHSDTPLPDGFDAVIEEFIGVVRGRGANSSRQPSVLAKQAEAPKKGAKASGGKGSGGKGSTPARTGGAGGKGGAGSGKGGGPNLRGGGRPGGKARAQKRGRRG